MILPQIFKEPLFHFMVLAGLIFSMEGYFSAHQKEKIVVSRLAADYLIKNREELQLGRLTLEQKKKVIDNYIEEEILLREAYKRGLDRSDSRMRRNLIRKMRGMLTTEVGVPSEADLHEFYEKNQRKYTNLATLSVQQVYFKDSQSVPENVLKELREGRDPATLGESNLNFPRHMPELNQRFIVSLFGSESARTILDIDDAQWHGPFLSDYGTHYVLITNRTPEKLVSYDQVAIYLRNDWRVAVSGNAVASKINKIIENYEITVE